MIEFYQNVYACYGPARCDFDSLLQDFVVSDSPSTKRFRDPYERFTTDGLTISNVDEIEISVIDVELHDSDGAPETGTVYLCTVDNATVVDSGGSVVNSAVSTELTTVVVANVDNRWMIVDTTTTKTESCDP